jgi:hypothetical protein
MTRRELEVPRRGGMSPKWFAILVFAIAAALWIGWFGLRALGCALPRRL